MTKPLSLKNNIVHRRKKIKRRSKTAWKTPVRKKTPRALCDTKINFPLHSTSHGLSNIQQEAAPKATANGCDPGAVNLISQVRKAGGGGSG